jgi:hypothetical protein
VNNSFWWAGPIAFRNIPTVDGRGITKDATIRLHKGGAPLLTMPGAVTSAEVVGKVGRVWDLDDTAIWAQIQIHERIGAFSGYLYPAMDLGPDYTLDDQPFPWFTSLEIIAVTLSPDPCWQGIGPIVRPKRPSK